MKALFVMPHWSNCFEQSKQFLDEAIESIFKQDDDHWHLIIIDDKSGDSNAVAHLKQLQLSHPDKLTVIFNPHNIGPGGCRNIGVNYAAKNNFDFILFLDADDISHPLRLSVCREIFKRNQNASVVYTTFSVIDEYSHKTSDDFLSSSIKEILDSHELAPPQGQNAWIDIGTKSGYTNLTSATAVRTSLAAEHPFPAEKVSEDMHTWLRYSAGGGDFVFTPLIPTLYRIPRNVEGSSSRSREGGAALFYKAKARVDEQGFKEAFAIAAAKGKVSNDMYRTLLVKFHLKLANTFLKAEQFDLAGEQLHKVNLTIDSLSI